MELVVKHYPYLFKHLQLNPSDLRDEDILHKILRSKTIRFMRDQRMFIFDNDTSFEDFVKIDHDCTDFDTICTRMAKDGTYIHHVELLALSAVLKVRFHVYKKNQTVFDEKNRPYNEIVWPLLIQNCLNNLCQLPLINLLQ